MISDISIANQTTFSNIYNAKHDMISDIYNANHDMISIFDLKLNKIFSEMF